MLFHKLKDNDNCLTKDQDDGKKQEKNSELCFEKLSILYNWTKDQDENIRRFASEAIRPHGVWSKHINELKRNPEMALPILEALKADKSKYVQDSVGNWLNDASKSQPDFVRNVCEQWNINASKETKYIIKKALRTITKKNKI